MRNAKSILAKRQRAYLLEITAPEHLVHKNKPMHFLQSLRLLDLMDHGAKHGINDAQAWMIVRHDVTLDEARSASDPLASQEVTKPRELA